MRRLFSGFGGVVSGSQRGSFSAMARLAVHLCSGPDDAKALVTTNPNHAERTAQSITDERTKAWTLSDVATAAATTDPSLAERIAQSITNERIKALALSKVAMATV
jgi:hypothetical protein